MLYGLLEKTVGSVFCKNAFWLTAFRARCISNGARRGRDWDREGHQSRFFTCWNNVPLHGALGWAIGP